MITCYIIDDQPHTIQLLELYIGLIPDLTLIGVESNAEIGLEKIYCKQIRPDITFLDIEMPVMSGIEIAAMVKDMTLVVFVSGHRQHGPEAYSLGVLDYLLKPFSFERFVQSIEKAKLRLAPKRESNPYIYLQDAGRNAKIKVTKKDILYILALPNYTRFVTKQTQHLSALTLSAALVLLADNSFARVHKSFIVNIHKIQSIEGNTIHMENKEQIPIGRSYKEAFLKLLEQ